MGKYETVSKLNKEEFRRLTGIRPETFQEMMKVLFEAERKNKIQAGKPNKLSLEDRLLMTLEYLREYRTYFHVGQSYGVSESVCWRNCRWVEDQLIKSGSLLSKFSIKDLLIHLSHVKKVKINSQWLSAEITNKTEKLLRKLDYPIT